jgi:hypothetical protein
MKSADPSAARGAAETIAAVLQRLLDETPGAVTTYGMLIQRLGRRGYGFAMLLLTAPNLMPGPSLPGFSTIFGVPMLALAAGMLLGVPNPRLPQWLAARVVKRERLERFIARLVPIAARADRALQPRWFALVDTPRLSGAWFAVLAILLILPVPFVSMAPATAALLIALGLIAQDGLAIALGLVVTVVGVVLYAVFGWLALAALGWV